MPFDYELLDDDPFELDADNRPHLFKHLHYGEEDIYDVYADALYYPASDDGAADWLMVGQPPGEPPLCVPLMPPRSGNPTKARPIGIYPATGPLLDDYLRDTGQTAPSTQGR